MENFFYELKHDIGADSFTVEEGVDFSFPMHMHRCFEMILLYEGSMKVKIEQEEHGLEAGDLILIKPNRVHSLETAGRSRHKLCIFSPELIAAISPQLMGYTLRDPVLRGLPSPHRELFDTVDRNAAIGGIKGFLYTLCDLFCSRLDMTSEDSATGKGDLIRDALRFVEENLHATCSLGAAAAALGYSGPHLCRVFKDTVGMPFTLYVRQVRINRACYLLKNTKSGITEIMSQCGYTSLATFNHNFKELTGTSPTQFRKRVKG